MSTITSRFNVVALVFAAGLLMSAPAFATNSDKNNNGKSNGSGSDAKVTICHATSSQTNPYVMETVSTSSIDEQNNKLLNGHGDHAGGVWSQGVAAHSWGDIIPAFTSPKGAKYAGQNMSEAGKSMLANSCKVKPTVKNNDDKKDEDKGKPVTVLPVEDKDDHKSTGQGSKKDDHADVKNKAATGATVAVKAATAGVGSVAATELPHTGAVSVMGLVGVIGASVYAAVRRFMK